MFFRLNILIIFAVIFSYNLLFTMIKINLKNVLVVTLLTLRVAIPAVSQDKLYSDMFPLGDVKLLEGPFKHAQELNIRVLLQYDVDRLLAPFLKEAGLEPKAELFPNWEGLDGHVGGHYLSALAMSVAATGNDQCEARMNYILSELDRCQKANGNGYIGGVPGSDKLWNDIKSGNVGVISSYWVPWYNVHKMYAGLRDAWLYAGNKKAKKMFLKLCDWGVSVVEPLSEEQMERMVGTEFGGMSEVYADAYQITGKEIYLKTAKRFTHHQLFDAMVSGVDNLDNRHANTQVPKAVGYARIAEVSGDENYTKAAEFFWDRVVNYRSIAFGGNSRREHFPDNNDYFSYVEEREGPETCNTYNMLKLSQDLFRMNSNAKYADFYEKALYNHILSTQHPLHGGYVYFTPARPAHYRVYSQPNSAMWCCVGSGMENHCKYGEFIYTHYDDDLYVNLFIASELNWSKKKVIITQQTSFPDEESSRITVNVKKPVKMKIYIRYPEWGGESGVSMLCDGKDYASGFKPSQYVVIDRLWNDGDVIDIQMEMKMKVEELRNVPNYIAIKRGPILLGVKTGTENMNGLVANDSRWAHIASGPLVSTFNAPYIVGTKTDIQRALDSAKPVQGDKNSFTISGLFNEKWDNATLMPFYRIHDSRYSIYYLTMTAMEYVNYQESLKAKEEELLALDRRTLDAISTGEQQPEVDHLMKSVNSNSGNYEGEAWRDARNGGYFEYTMDTQGRTDLSLMVRYWGNETDRNRSFDILIDGVKLISENISRKWGKSEFVNVEYAIPDSMLQDKSNIKVRFQSGERTVAGGIFYIRIVAPTLINE